MHPDNLFELSSRYLLQKLFIDIHGEITFTSPLQKIEEQPR